MVMLMMFVDIEWLSQEAHIFTFPTIVIWEMVL